MDKEKEQVVERQCKEVEAERQHKEQEANPSSVV